MADATHTPGPWGIALDTTTGMTTGLYDFAIVKDSVIVAQMVGSGEAQKASALRIVACLNACEGIPTKALETGRLSALIDVAVAYVGATLQRRTTDEHFEMMHEIIRELVPERLAEWEIEAS